MANTLSLIVRQQLPEYIRSEYETFVLFVEAYFAWMDKPGNTTNISKNMLSNMDLDTTQLDDFITFFTKQFLPLFPPQYLTNPTFFIQHAKEFYRAKGTNKSVKLLFRLLFQQDIDIFFPKDSILRSSESGWKQSRSLRLDGTMWTIQVADGITKRFRALDTSRTVTPSLYLNGVLQTLNTHYTHSTNEPWFSFLSTPTVGYEVKAVYQGTDFISHFGTNEIVAKFVGQTSGASAISETLQQVTEDGITQLDLEVTKPLGIFSQFELVRGRWTYDVNAAQHLDIYGQLVSYLRDIVIVDGGTRYNVGDTVVISGGFPVIAATATVDSIFSALISNITVLVGGAGYQPGQSAYITSTPNTGLNAFVLSVDTSEAVHPNSYPMNQDVLTLWANTVMSNSDYYFTSSVSENVNSLMSIAFTDFLFGEHPIERLGPVSSLTITSSTQVFNPAPTLAIDPPIVHVTGITANGDTATANVSLAYFGILGKMNVRNGGSNYQVGDEVSFENIPGVGLGIGAAAEVTSLHVANTGIKTVNFRPSRLTGNVTVNTAVSNVQVVGTGTFFTTELVANDHIEINSESSYVSTIINATHLTVNTAFTRNSTSRRLGIYGRYFVGGMNYRQEALPTVRVSSNEITAIGADVAVDLVLSGGASFLLEPQTQEPIGKIKTIRITNHGYGYQSPPVIDLTGSGNGKANAIAVMLSNLFIAPGRFTTTEGFLSSDRKLENDGYYTTYSYVVRAETELAKYSGILKDLTHPAGMKLWGEYVISDIVTQNSISAQSV